MKFVSGFLGVCYDLVIGDCWQIAAAVVLLVVGGVVLLRLDAIALWLLPVAIAVTIMTVVPLIIIIEARAAMRRMGD
ncbi:MAG: hypothetical protein BMS9Abin01_1582 [Gammaproteobacteria bacterium]|nr:MAG: hypothetical protein BMS9Abin01_1582 [Gammaproteobacteria bacterium]